MAVITKNTALKELHKAVDTLGREHVAEICEISDDNGAPLCIVGQVYSQLAPRKFKTVKPKGIVVGPAEMMGLRLRPEAARILRVAQMLQDGDLIDGLPNAPLPDLSSGKRKWGQVIDFVEANIEKIISLDIDDIDDDI